MNYVFDLQDILEQNLGRDLVERRGLHKYGDSYSLRVEDVEDARTLLLSERTDNRHGITLDLNKINAGVGDRLVITGRVNTEQQCSVHLLRKSGENDPTPVKHVFIERRSKMYVLPYVLQPQDIKNMLVFSTMTYHQSPPVDFYIDNITILHSEGGAAMIKETRDVLYDMQNDRYLKHLEQEGYSEYLFVSGGPLREVFANGEKSVRVYNRENNWDGIDMRTQIFGMIKGTSYKIDVTGAIIGTPPQGAEMILQLLPAYSWHSVTFVSDENQAFTLRHEITPEELESLEGIRVTTNDPGVTMEFIITGFRLYT